MEKSTRHSEAGRRRGAGGGDVRAAILLLLDEWPMRALQLERAISERSGTLWAPGPGSIYPALSALEVAGMVSITQVRGRNTAGLTPSGVAFVDENREALGEPWDHAEDAVFAPTALLREIAGTMRGAALRIASSGSDAQVVQAEVVLGVAATALGRILAEDDDAGPQ